MNKKRNPQYAYSRSFENSSDAAFKAGAAQDVPLKDVVEEKALLSRGDSGVLTERKLQLLRKEKALLEKQAYIQSCLPHIYGFKWYPWSKTYFEDTHRIQLLTAANQIGKSTTQIRKMISWATEKERWEGLWPGKVPTQFWYMYPDSNTATTEFHTKWIPTLLPRNEYKDHPKYGWEAEYQAKKIHAIHFKSGVSCYFKFYSQSVTHLQAASPYAVFSDEELPMDYYDEVMMRLQATEGYFSMVFTATLNQDFWRRAMEGKGTDEVLKDAFKIQVSMYDCMYHTDGTPSQWTDKKIKHIESLCASDIEVQRRVYGRFISEGGLRYPAFNAEKHVVAPFEIPKDWLWYTAVDIGGGGSTRHPSAFVMVAVKPDHSYGVVAKAWRGDGIETTASDVLDRYRAARGNIRPVLQLYDHSSVDFGMIASRLGENFLKADKDQKRGVDTVNTLFRGKMLSLFDTDEIRKLVVEYGMLPYEKDRKQTGRFIDDLSDCVRYVCLMLPWDWSKAAPEALEDAPKEMKPKVYSAMELEVMARRGEFIKRWDEYEGQQFEEELEEINNLYEGVYE